MNDKTSKSPLEMQVNDIRKRYLNPMRDPALETYIHDETVRHRADGVLQRDYARIMYSSSFRRLQGKMQLLGIKKDQFFRNRLTHSLEVAQIARSLAGMMHYDEGESYVVEAGALAHDLGNPPFGHSGETFLNSKFGEIGGFEGNAQTLRIMTGVEKKRPDFRGLNLTYRTMFSVVKYFNKFDPKLHEQGKKQKFIYDDDYDLLKAFIDEHDIAIRTIDVQIVDIADEIAYAAHDLEDALRLKAFTIDELLHDYKVMYGNSESLTKLEEIVTDARNSAGYGERKLDSSQYSKLFRQELTSQLINLFLNDVGMKKLSDKDKLKTGSMQDEELGFLQYGELVKGLKILVFQCINHNDGVYSYEQSGNLVLDYLADLFLENKMYLPPEYRADILAEQYEDLQGIGRPVLQKRLVCDYVSGMMDSYAISVYEKYSGKLFMGGHH